MEFIYEYMGHVQTNTCEEFCIKYQMNLEYAEGEEDQEEPEEEEKKEDEEGEGQ